MIHSDLHTHTTFSHDGRSTATEMAAQAFALGLTHYGFSEHFDHDYPEHDLRIDGVPPAEIDAAAYFAAARRLQREYAPRGMQLLVGCECGFDPSPRCNARYRAMIERFCPDYVINSVHTVAGKEAYFAEYFQGKTKEEAYASYLSAVRASLDAAYPYDIVAHIGYASRNAPYEDRKLRYRDYAARYDDILRTIVERGKILEVNSSSRGAGSEFLPDADVLARYFELGGRLISFASDAHEISRIGDKRAMAEKLLLEIGFTDIAVPCRGKITLLPLAD